MLHCQKRIVRQTHLCCYMESRDEIMLCAILFYKTNCVGTKNMLALAGQMKSLKRFVYISTAYVAGQKSGIVMEADKPGREFSSLYEKSKAEAEEMVRSSDLASAIIRPGMIVGDSKTGWIRNFNTIYYVLKLMLLGRLPVLPTSPEASSRRPGFSTIRRRTVGRRVTSRGRFFQVGFPT